MMGIFVVVKCNECGAEEEVRQVFPATVLNNNASTMNAEGRRYILPEGWINRYIGSCFCSDSCLAKEEARRVRKEIESQQAKLKGILERVGVVDATEEE